MTSEQETRLADQILHGNVGHILPADSFTAQRLKHASARHLHLTSRRVFIGPIPESWIADNRKSWANYRPRVLTTYSSRTATFNAAKTVSELRALTGLDVDGDHRQRHKISFPQPTDVDDDTHSDASVQNAEQTVPQQDGPDSETQVTSTRPSVLTSTDSYESAGSESYVTARTKQRGPKSFVTAREQLGSVAETEQDVQSSNAEPDVTTSKPADESSGHTSPTVSKHDSMAGIDIRRSDSHDSTQALLTHDERNIQAGSHKPKKRVRILDSLPGSAVPPEPSSQMAAMHQLPPEAYEGDNMEDAVGTAARRGLVRFTLPAEAGGKRDRLRETISRAKDKVVGKDYFSAQAEPGQLLKAERMLIRVEVSKHDIPSDYEEKYSAKAETTLLEKWREYVVTCRKDINGDGFVLNMAKTRVLPKRASEQVSKKAAHRIALKPHVTKINLFSPLDKTIVIWQAEKKTTKIFILRPRSSVSSIQWLTFLNFILGYKISDALHISVPDLDVDLEVFNPLNKPDASNNAERADTNGDLPENDTSKTPDNGHGARQIMMRALHVLQNSDFQDVLAAWREKDERLGLVWRQYDRLEWVHGISEEHMYSTSAMQKTHELEIRPKMHYPTSASVKAESGHEELEEPEPIEGFLVLQTSQKGRESLMGKTYFKKLYFSTHNHLLCFLAPDKAVPPKPPEVKEALQGGTRNAGMLANKVPLIYPVDPYPLQDGRVNWLSSSNATEVKEHDHHAYEENERAVHLLLEADGYINMCHIKHIRKYKPHKDGELPATNETDHDDSDTEDGSNASSSATKKDVQRSFVLHLNNGLAVRLQAYDKVARKEWVKRLRMLSTYWKHRTAGDIGNLKDVRQQNLTGLGIDEETESIVGQVAEKWEVSKSIASPELFHMCGISHCRQVTMSGILYRKPRMHSSFRKCMAVLCHGKLLIFQATLRTYSGRERLHILHEKEEVVDLRESYVYSGSLTEDDLLYQNKTFDSNHPGHNALPRVFREDDWTSVDEDSTTCFVIWHGRRKSFFKANAEKGDGKFMSQIRYVSSLGVPGRSMVFKTRSRAERDHWVTNVSMEIERLQRTEDIRVVETK